MNLKLIYLLFILMASHLACQSTNRQPLTSKDERQGVDSLKDSIIKIPAQIMPVEFSESDWKNKLEPLVFHVMREKGTERAFTGNYWDNHQLGIYVCNACSLPLFDSDYKFESGTGWPSFTKPIEERVVSKISDNDYGMSRTEVLCARCKGHLGHVFDDGPQPTGLRYCMNSASLKFIVNARCK